MSVIVRELNLRFALSYSLDVPLALEGSVVLGHDPVALQSMQLANNLAKLQLFATRSGDRFVGEDGSLRYHGHGARPPRRAVRLPRSRRRVRDRCAGKGILHAIRAAASRFGSDLVGVTRTGRFLNGLA